MVPPARILRAIGSGQRKSRVLCAVGVHAACSGADKPSETTMANPRPEKPRPPGNSANPTAGDRGMPPTEHRLQAMKEQDDSIIPVTKPEDDVMDVLAEFETGLESLKALYV